MFNFKSFYRTGVSKLPYWCLFYENNSKKIASALKESKTYFVSQGLNEIKCKSHQKLQENLK